MLYKKARREYSHNFRIYLVSIMRTKFTIVLLASIILIYNATAQDNQSLRYHADRKDVFIGAAVSNAFFGFTPTNTYVTTLKGEFNALVAENAMKFGPLRPSETTFNFNSADYLVDFALDNNMEIRGHALIWHNQLPSWVEEGDFSRDELLAVMEEHITTVVGRYKGQIREWDVVNEAIVTNTPDNFRRTIFYNTIGPEYIDSAFVYAHRADPDALLFYNDYSAESINEKSNVMYEMVQGMLERGIPIHGVGLQSHFILNSINFSSMDQNMKRFADLGLLTNITELDIRMHNSLFDDPQALADQAENYKQLMELCLENESCTSFIMWGFTDAFSWVPGFFENYGNALIYDHNYHPKPARDSLFSTLSDGYDFPSYISHHNLSDLDIKVFPNPAKDNITIESKTGKTNLKTEIFDLTGRKVLEVRHQSLHSENIDLSTISKSGTYILTISNKENKIQRSIIQIIK